MKDFEHPLAYTNVELEGIFRKRIKRRIPKLWEVERKFYDTYAPKQYVKVVIFVPQPTLEAPFPCVLTMIATAHRSVFFRLASPDELSKVLYLTEEELEDARVALCSAEEQAENIKTIITQHLALKDRPDELKKVLGEAEQVLKQKAEGST